jgi:hypothetical protein
MVERTMMRYMFSVMLKDRQSVSIENVADVTRQGR